MEERNMGKERSFRGFGQKLSGGWLEHKDHIMKKVPEARDVRIQSYSTVPAWSILGKDEFQIKKHGFFANELVNVYDVDFIEKEGCKDKLEKRIKKLTKGGVLGYYIWSETRILKTQIILKRVGRYDK